ncbi:MAG: Rrf2 family transcriptional regulator [Gemmatimonadales bacterium]|nr:Rrf2 family transcriptional regulator [Gemmatimonadales bacterium]
MRVTTWTEYSLIISLHLARRHRDGLGSVAARELSEAERLPADYAEQILLRLRRSGVVESTRGAKGGYRLAKDPAEINVHSVMTAAEHQTFELNCTTHAVNAAQCAPGASCSIRPMWTALQQRIDSFLQGVTLADLLHDEAQVQQLVARDPS